VTQDQAQDQLPNHSGIRIATPADAAAIQAIYAPYVAESAISFETEVPSVDEMARRITRISEKFPWLVYELGGEVAGYAYSSAHRERAAYGWSADTAIYIDATAHRRGIGRLLYRRLIAISSLQGIHTLYGGITLPNPGSVGLHEACGFSQIGIYREVGYKLGAWRDVGWWGLQLNPPATNPAPLIPFNGEIYDRASRSAV
jgi:L-amino acid N-acyltransferase YncA